MEPSGRGPGSYRHIKLETATRAQTMESSARDDSALADAASSAPDPYEYVIPEARSLSSSDNESEKESPSQYRMEQMRKRDSDGSQSGSDGQSSSGDEEVEIPEDEIPPDEFVDEVEHVPRAVLNKNAALKVDCHALMRKMNTMSQHLQAVMRLQAEHNREKRRREDDQEVGDPGPSTLAHRARAAAFTPPRKKQRHEVPPTPESDDEDLESLSSHASSSRKKLQPDFLFVASKDTPKFTDLEIREWIRNYAIEQMAKAGPYIDKKPLETDVGGMKLAHVRLLSSS